MSSQLQNPEGGGEGARKQCPECGEIKAVAQFSKNAARPDGLQYYCKPCSSRRSARTYRERQERRGRRVRERVSAPEGHKYCPGCTLITPLSNWHRNATTHDGYAAYCKDCRRIQGREQHLKRSLGLTLEAAAALIENQDGLCAICRNRPVQHIDHDHETDTVRGGLCGPCNMGLGQFQDKPDLLLAAAAYLRSHGRPAETWPKPILVECFPYRGVPIEYTGYRHSA